MWALGDAHAAPNRWWLGSMYRITSLSWISNFKLFPKKNDVFFVGYEKNRPACSISLLILNHLFWGFLVLPNWYLLNPRLASTLAFQWTTLVIRHLQYRNTVIPSKSKILSTTKPRLRFLIGKTCSSDLDLKRIAEMVETEDHMDG